MLTNYNTRINLKVNISDTLNMLAPYLRKADTTLMLSKYLRKADTSLLNLTSRFATKLNLSDTASMLTNYLRSGTAALTYQTILTNPITGTGTTNTLPLFTGSSTLGNSAVQQSSNNIGINTTPFASLTMGQGKNIMLDASSNNIPRILFYESNARNENDVQFGAKIQYNSPSDRLEFIMRDSFSADPSGDELAMSMVRQTGNTTIHKDLTVTGNITEGGNNVLTNLDTASLSTRIDAKYNSSGGTISGAVTLSETSATPSSLLGKSTGNVVGTVTTVAQTGLFGRGSVTNEVTDANGIITVAHGFGFTPNMAFANLPAQTANTVNVKSVDATNIVFVVRDGATFIPLNTQTVSNIQFFAIK